MADTPAKRQKVEHDTPSMPHFDDFAPNGDVIFIVEGKNRVRVDSGVMKRASSVFAAMLGPNFKEGRALAEADNAPVEISLPEDNGLFFYWICRALHCQAHTKLWAPVPDQLLLIWSLIDKYDMKDSMQLSFGLWTKVNVNKEKQTLCLWLVALASLLNQDADSFQAATQRLILYTRRPFLEIAQQLEPRTEKTISGREIYKLAGELQAARDCAVTNSTKLFYFTLPAALGACNQNIASYFRKISTMHRGGFRSPGLAFFETASPLASVPGIVSAIDEWAFKPCVCGRQLCVDSMLSVRKQTSEFKVEMSGLCLDCFDKEPCAKHKKSPGFSTV